MLPFWTTKYIVGGEGVRGGEEGGREGGARNGYSATRLECAARSKANDYWKNHFLNILWALI